MATIEDRNAMLDGPLHGAGHAALATPSDDDDLPRLTRGLSFSTAGDLKVTMVGGDTLIIPEGALAAGIIHPLRVSRVWSTGTTAAGVVVYW